jgi:hypothetical protein
MTTPVVVLRCPACAAVLAMTEPTYRDWIAEVAQLRCGLCPDEPGLQPTQPA